MKVLNLYAGIGGNRRLWENVEVTAVEINPSIAAIYKDFFPKDKVIIDDAHKFLLEHYKEFDFIWSSPPCPTHTSMNNILNAQGLERYPDMKLYQEIIFLKHFFKGKWVIENVIGYYEPLIKPQTLGRHYFWASDPLGNYESSAAIIKERYELLERKVGFKIRNFHNFKGDKRKLLRNCVDSKLGLHIFKMLFKTKQTELKTW